MCRSQQTPFSSSWSLIWPYAVSSCFGCLRTSTNSSLRSGEAITLVGDRMSRRLSISLRVEGLAVAVIASKGTEGNKARTGPILSKASRNDEPLKNKLEKGGWVATITGVYKAKSSLQTKLMDNTVLKKKECPPAWQTTKLSNDRNRKVKQNKKMHSRLCSSKQSINRDPVAALAVPCRSTHAIIWHQCILKVDAAHVVWAITTHFFFFGGGSCPFFLR